MAAALSVPAETADLNMIREKIGGARRKQTAAHHRAGSKKTSTAANSIPAPKKGSQADLRKRMAQSVTSYLGLIIDARIFLSDIRI